MGLTAPVVWTAGRVLRIASSLGRWSWNSNPDGVDSRWFLLDPGLAEREELL
jgi:hypothetical protein